MGGVGAFAEDVDIRQSDPIDSWRHGAYCNRGRRSHRPSTRVQDIDRPLAVRHRRRPPARLLVTGQGGEPEAPRRRQQHVICSHQSSPETGSTKGRAIMEPLITEAEADVPLILVYSRVRMLEKRARSASSCHFPDPSVHLTGGEVRLASRFKISRSHPSRAEQSRPEATWHQERPRVPL
jgi:hypothetical protein